MEPAHIKDERFQNLVRNIQADPGFLWRRPILATADGTIYAGNMRYRAAQHLGMATVPAIIEDIPERLAKERALRYNHQWGDWQDDQLAEMIYQMAADGSDLDLLGFDERELQKLLDSLAPPDDADPDDVPGASRRRSARPSRRHPSLHGNADCPNRRRASREQLEAERLQQAGGLTS